MKRIVHAFLLVTLITSTATIFTSALGQAEIPTQLVQFEPGLTVRV